MLESYSETRVVLTPSGELMQAIPIYANQNGSLFNAAELKSFIGDDTLSNRMSIGVYEQLGFMLYHPSQPYCFYLNSLELFEDLGVL